MGKGDTKTAKGKRYIRSYGNARPHGAVTAAVAKATPASKAPVAAVKKAAAKKKA